MDASPWSIFYKTTHEATQSHFNCRKSNHYRKCQLFSEVSHLCGCFLNHHAANAWSHEANIYYVNSNFASTEGLNNVNPNIKRREITFISRIFLPKCSNVGTWSE